MSFFSTITAVPPNSILGVALDCKNDPYPGKIDLTIGAYRDDTGKPYVLPVVRKAEEIILSQNLDHEYLAQDGHPVFVKESQILMFGSESVPLKENRIYSIQGISGTGSLRLAFDFIGQLMPGRGCIIPSVTWPNHPAILKACGIKTSTYRYLDSSGCRLDFQGMMDDINNADDGSVILLHSCAHNPSGVDPSEEQWSVILEAVQRKVIIIIHYYIVI